MTEKELGRKAAYIGALCSIAMNENMLANRELADWLDAEYGHWLATLGEALLRERLMMIEHTWREACFEPYYGSAEQELAERAEKLWNYDPEAFHKGHERHYR